MAKQTVISREELEKNEQQLEFAEVALFWLRQHANKIFTVLLIIFAAYAALIAINHRKESARAEASDLLFSAYQDFDKGLEFPWSTAERVTAMESARLKADEILKKFKGEPIARSAMLLRGNTFFFQGDQFGSAQNTQNAIAAFTDFDTEATKIGDPFEMAAAQLALGYAQENLAILVSDNPDALLTALNAAQGHYDNVEKKIGEKAGFLYYEALNARGRLAATNRDRDVAIQYYKRVYTARRQVLPEPDSNSRRAQMLHQIRQLAGSFTVGSTARIQLQRLGVDVETLDRELDGKTAVN